MLHLPHPAAEEITVPSTINWLQVHTRPILMIPGPTELASRTEAALTRRPGRAAIPADEIDEIRIVASWVAEHEPPSLTLDPMPTPESLLRFLGSQASCPAMSA